MNSKRFTKEEQAIKKRLWMNKWRRENPEEAKKRGRESYHRRVADPVKKAALFAKQNERSKTKKYLDKKNARRKGVRRLRYKNDLNYNLETRIRSRINAAFQGRCKSAGTASLIDCSVDELKRHIESLFREGMDWNNRHLWHIDHIRPCASFDLTDPVQQRCCFHYSNLQPLWAKDNIMKSANFPAHA